MLSPPQLQSGMMQAHAVRLPPKTDLVSSIINAAEDAMMKSQSSSACILSVVGSLEYVKLRMANASRRRRKEGEGDGDGNNDEDGQEINDIKEWNERLEIVSLVGTIANGGEKHLHMSVSDREGRVWGGHVVAGRIFTTLELVLGTIQGVTFKRELDGETGYKELVVSSTETTPDDDDGEGALSNPYGVQPQKKSKKS